MGDFGSCGDLAAKVASELLDQGATNLEAKIASHIAAFGGNCWQTDKRLAGLIPKDRFGARYHRKSIQRARSMLAKAGYLKVKRVFGGQVPDGADYPSSHGTTNKYISWKTLGIRPPPKSERRKAAQKQRTEERHERMAKPRYAAPSAIVAPNPSDSGRPKASDDPELAQMCESWLRSAQSARTRRTASIEQDAVRQGPEPDPPK